ncbi:TetR/AcrR family transcriptional regulator [Glaciibacter flavus]|uniref:TetR/AcrR family transcriptional regulator n=1 Tax=Orlajensenia flava TaxID=2565934 RepID=A0A4S4FUE4_9MICO|nr:TetR/AcrR family transcriptional regulator [Glaciibacter flavus]
MPTSSDQTVTNREQRRDPRPARSRELILDAALPHFLAHGFTASTVEGIAVAAGVAKRTVYNLFPTKDDLFRSVIHRSTETSERFITERVESDIGVGEFHDEILAFALTHARAVLSPDVIATRRLLIGESRIFPELAAEYFERVPSAVLQAIAARLERYHELGLLHIDDPRTAAEHFAYLVLGAALDRALLEPRTLEPHRVTDSATAGATTFLRAYSP